MRLLCAGGGSGGHVTPVLAVINELAKTDPSLEVMFVCDKAFFEQAKGLMAHATVPVEIVTVPAGKFRRYSNISLYQKMIDLSTHGKNAVDLFKLMGGLSKSIKLFQRFRPDVVFAKGGFVCLPVGYAANLLKIPLVIHDSDARPGLTNRLLAGYASRIATGMPVENYPTYKKSITTQTGVPIGDKFRIYSQAEQGALRSRLGLASDRPVVVITGGGLGSMSINRAILSGSERLLQRGVQIYHICGKNNYNKLRGLVPKDENYKLVPFVYENMHEILAVADVVVARGSATFMQELAALARPTIMIPAKVLGDQVKNAEIYERANAAVVLSDDAIAQGDTLVLAILELLDNPDYSASISTALHAFARPDAATQVAKLILEVVAQPKGSHEAVS
ncbi:UDP-N-acetylglucosamine--N-acetylmuramyl-(pentapeptide) pyrophosphoryl-undecaprenol N-acetylglucosamine transferase [Candidatus Saccharibacteria bacterium]|nr:UDP-N-acetylglucosamine--N-acetylmuramyl-(pentapeptide) pyrophosphoryl-undecaprenol N-acetylglucosamine transferase [Candidatus Saccharibacteria bacterium]